MGIYNEKLWSILEGKAGGEHSYLAAVKTICDDAVALSKTIRDVFPLYTLHDEDHICNVMRHMVALLGDQAEQLERDTAAMLVLAACCHDLGMCCDPADPLPGDADRLREYLDKYPAVRKAVREDTPLEKLPDDVLRGFLRATHHARVREVIQRWDCFDAFGGLLEQEALANVCRSHGEDAEEIRLLEPGFGPDLRLCAILLRLADLLDFDTSRAPRALYHYAGFDNREDTESRISRTEWDKHISSHGFHFEKVRDRAQPYELPYAATCRDMQTQQAISTYLDWVDRELVSCNALLRYCEEPWSRLVLPHKVGRSIVPKGYVPGEFRLTLDQDKVLKLLTGDNLYQDSAVFVRELLQNAIDAVRTRQALQKPLPRNWKPQINIRSWVDGEGYHWFRIEDNGIGMTQKIIENYFLTVANSYYESDDFLEEKLRCQADRNYTPISRFGIGILSCFMGDRKACQVEVSTRHFKEGSQPIRMSMHGMNGYYYLTDRTACPRPAPMKGVTEKEKAGYRSEPGTVIAVRTNLYHSGKYRSFREILDQYIAYPPVPIHYEDADGSVDYPTEQMLMDDIHAIHPSEDPEQRGTMEFRLSDEQVAELEAHFPGLKVEERPGVMLKCEALDLCTESPNLSGAVLMYKKIEGKYSISVNIGGKVVTPKVIASAGTKDHKLRLMIKIVFPDHFEERMRLLGQETSNVERDLEVLLSRLEDRLTIEMIKRISRGYSPEEGWFQYLGETYNVSVSELRKRFAELEAEYALTLQEFVQNWEAVAAYKALSDDIVFNLVNLEQYQWYRKHFGGTVPRERFVAAHNGISFGGGGFFLHSADTSTRCSILLMKDGYRPELDVARAQIQSIPLELDMELELLRLDWRRQGYVLRLEQKTIDDPQYWRIPTEQYMQVLAGRRDLADKLRFDTVAGELSKGQLRDRLRGRDKLGIYNCPRLHSTKMYAREWSLVGYATMAYLRSEFALDSYRLGSNVKIYETMSDQTENVYWKAFPPTFFLTVSDEEIRFTRKEAYFRYFCDESHPLSRYLIDHREELERLVPGLFWEIMQSIAADDADEMILTVNDCLTRIRALPYEDLWVPQEAFLKESDFC